MPLAPNLKIYGEMVHPAYTGLNELGVTEANIFYEKFNSKNKSTEVLEKYLQKLQPKNLLDRMFYGSLLNSRIVKRAAVRRILSDRKGEFNLSKNIEKLISICK